MKTYGLIGLGLIGGSIVRSLKKQPDPCRIIASSRSRAPLEAALSEHMIDAIAESPADPLFSECDMIFVCTPVQIGIEALKELKQVLSPHTLLTDVGSVKTDIHEAIEELGLADQFIGGHPMAGSEKTGFSNSSDHLFENAYYILTPTDTVPAEKVEEYRQLAASFGALPMVLSYKEHDYITAAVSHLPHVIASSLVNTVHNLDGQEQHMKMIAAGGFKDITRIASSSPEMWEQICMTNQANIRRVMDEFIELLQKARDDMETGNGDGIHQMFADSREYRNSFVDASHGAIKKKYALYCDVIDEAGAIATIATILAVNQISIRNIGIVHNREYEQGALYIEFYEQPALQAAAKILRHHRYIVWET